ncbi:hypothetical protein [Bittarella massiliensis (ex Durand et al. 2017)]|uniref:hypothetical protein n=1 Tax=Bittarella massiliensis (ex Durand et al. 2017) TaxID=1720313 RepID=UPI001AA0F0EA|nr:hypothetical protein [Bittarella massiliensis (ex Durand et al. 2017)]MBO1678519.1 hypothetical protein [Bittarella massiliensis (ex Durand et al. 2017)]
MEQHLAKLSYKTAVEIAQVHLMLVSMLETPCVDTKKLRGGRSTRAGTTRHWVQG